VRIVQESGVQNEEFLSYSIQSQLHFCPASSFCSWLLCNSGDTQSTSDSWLLAHAGALPILSGASGIEEGLVT
jgi:hypothetical protein